MCGDQSFQRCRTHEFTKQRSFSAIRWIVGLDNFFTTEKTMETILLIILRLVAGSIFAVGAVWLASEGKEGWGWCIFAAIVLGGITIKKYRVGD